MQVAEPFACALDDACAVKVIDGPGCEKQDDACAAVDRRLRGEDDEPGQLSVARDADLSG